MVDNIVPVQIPPEAFMIMTTDFFCNSNPFERSLFTSKLHDEKEENEDDFNERKP